MIEMKVAAYAWIIDAAFVCLTSYGLRADIGAIYQA